MFLAAPLHGGAGIVPGMLLKDPQGIRRGKSLFRQNMEIVDALYIPVVGKLFKIPVGHAQLFSLIDKGRPP